MAVAESALAAAQQLNHLPVLDDFAQELAGIGIKHCRAYRHFDYTVLAVAPEGTARASALSVGGEYMPLVTQVEQRPQVAVATHEDVSATAAVATVRPALGDILGAVEMARSRAPLARAAQDFYIVYKVGFCHWVILF